MNPLALRFLWDSVAFIHNILVEDLLVSSFLSVGAGNFS